MKRRVEDWTVEKLHKARTRISFPEYQRQPNLWSAEKKKLLIDSILKDIDIPKLYLNETKSKDLEVVDGTQRLWSVWEFLDDVYPCNADGKSVKFSELSPRQRDLVRKYELQLTILEDAPDEYLRELFVRLQLGLLLVTGEKLNALTGAMKTFVFDQFSAHKFIRELSIPNRRHAKATLCAQIAVNSFTRAKLQAFARTRYEDLQFFFQEYEHPQGQALALFRKQSKLILDVASGLWECFGPQASELGNRSYILSVYLLFEDIEARITSAADRKTFVGFVLALWARLKQESKAGIDRSNRELFAFETMLSSAPGERYQIERRHQKMVEYYDYFKSLGKIKGDK